MSGQLGDPELEDPVVDHIAKRTKLDDSVDTTGVGVRQRGAVVGREERLVEKIFGVLRYQLIEVSYACPSAVTCQAMPLAT